ncbi:endoglucanase A [bacterium]|nr:MAG: endoglucanase A [bacterium]
MTMLLALLLPLPPAEISVDLKASYPISPYIYGANFPDWEALQTPFTVSRLGGNRMTAYNWENNASNAGNDYRHQNDGYMGESDEPGKTMLDFMKAAQKNGAHPILTVPTAGYVSADKGPEDDVNKTPNYLETRFHKSLPSKPGGKYDYPPNKKDKFVYQDEFARWISRQSQQPLWFSLDNEPDLWSSTHARIVAKNPGYAGILANNIAFAEGIRRVAPKSWIFGPANYGWQGFRRFQDATDGNGRDFLDFYLAGMKEAGQKSGKRLLDVLDIHWYPEAQGGGKRIVMGDDGEINAEARIQAPRSLWDPEYVETSWISDSIGKKPIVLIPGVKAQIQKQYPGTKFAITEYDFGGAKSTSGMLAQADVLGIFGRTGVDVACHWGIGKDRPATLAGFRAFLDYDGKGGRFGTIGRPVMGEDPATNSVYAASDPAKRALTLVILNKSSADQPFRIKVGTQWKSGGAYLAHADRPLTPSGHSMDYKDGEVSLTVPSHGVVTVELN